MAVLAGLTPLEAFLNDPDVDERAELILGKVVQSMPESSEHFTTAVELFEALRIVFGNVAVFREAPLAIPDNGFLKPDVVVMREARSSYGKPMRYSARDIQIVVEVSASTAGRDYGSKELQYAQAGIPEYWIVDVDNGRVVRRTDPTQFGYASQELFGPNDAIAGISVASFLVSV